VRVVPKLAADYDKCSAALRGKQERNVSLPTIRPLQRMARILRKATERFGWGGQR